MSTAAAAAVTTAMPAAVHAVSGSISSALAMLLFYPLERARVELQAVTANAEEEEEEEEEEETSVPPPPQATHLSLHQCLVQLFQRHELYRGCGPYVVTLAVSSFVFFYIHEGTKRYLFETKRNKNNVLLISNNTDILLASCLAGIGNVILTNPLWLVNLRIVSGQATHSFPIAELISVAQQFGVKFLWTGTGTALWLVTNPVLQFVVYEYLKKNTTNNSSSSSWGPLRAFTAGAMSKACATCVTYPLQLTQSVLRLQKRRIVVSNNNNNSNNNTTVDETTVVSSSSIPPPVPATIETELRYTGVMDCLVKLYRRGGIPGLYVGMRAKLIQAMLTTAFTFLSYEQLLAVVHKVHRAAMMMDSYPSSSSIATALS